MKIIARTCSVAFCAMLVAIGAMGGCTAATGGTDAAGEPVPSGAPSATPVEVGSISAFDATVTFYTVTLDGHTNIGMMETASAFAQGRLVAPLLAQQLTTQEIYLALAPEGATAPPALVAAQADEAASLRRSAAVRHVTVDASPLVEKNLIACEGTIGNAIPPPDGSNDWWEINSGRTYTNSYGSQYSDHNCTYTQNWVILGACNETSVALNIVAGEFYGNSCGNLSYISAGGGNGVTMGGFGSLAWYWQNPGGAEYFIGTPASDHVSGTQYDLVVGQETCNPASCQICSCSPGSCSGASSCDAICRCVQ
jgi:hypothetical protein